MQKFLDTEKPGVSDKNQLNFILGVPFKMPAVCKGCKNTGVCEWTVFTQEAINWVRNDPNTPKIVMPFVCFNCMATEIKNQLI